MHLQTHIMSGWCVANLLPLTPRQRMGAMIAASAADLDGLGIVFGQDAYFRYHHVVGHNLLFGVVVSLILLAITRGRIGVFVLYLALFHLHLLMDFFGSGPGWAIAYEWPFSQHAWDNRHWSWAFYSWQNISTAVVLVAWTILIARRQGRTPLEVIMPKLDRQLVQILRRGKRSPPSEGTKRPAADACQLSSTDDPGNPAS